MHTDFVPAHDPVCGCAENERAGLTRRHLIQLTAAAGLVTATTVNDARVAFGAPMAGGTGGDVLVVLSLRGGFDGLSAVVPASDANYRKLRPNTAVPAASLKQVDSTFGLAPGLKPLYSLWDSGKVAAIHAVGQEDPTRSHFEAMAEMERAAPGSSLRTGWIDRSIGMLSDADAFAGAQVGNGTMPGSLYGPNPKFAVANLTDVRIGVDEQLVPSAAWTRAMAGLHRGARPEVVQPTSNALAAVAKLKKVPKTGDAASVGYPSGALGPALHDVARLIKANLGLRFATVDYGNWDMHQNMGNGTAGWMFNQLTELSGAMAAFAKELGDDFNRVTVVTLSEFGRRTAENGSAGLDHGHGNAVLVMGGNVNGGKVYGAWPGLSAGALDDGDLAGRTDYRSVMAEILTKRCKISGTSKVFPGLSAKTLGFVKG